LPNHLCTIDTEIFHQLHSKTVTISLILALFDEWHQAFVPGITAQPFDIVYNSLGFMVAYSILFIIWRYYREFRHPKILLQT
jgi:VanZ family protein